MINKIVKESLTDKLVGPTIDDINNVLSKLSKEYLEYELFKECFKPISNLKIIKILLDNGADVNVHDDIFRGETPLIYATKRGNLELIKFLIQNGADVNSTDKEGWNVLMFAVINLSIDRTKKSFEIIKILLDNDADVNTKSRTGLDVFELAENDSLNDVLELLNKYKKNYGHVHIFTTK